MAFFSIHFSLLETGFELRNRFYTTDCYTAVCVLVVFSCTVDTQVYTCVLLACIRWEFRNKFRVLTRWKKLSRRKHMMISILMMRKRKIKIRLDTLKSSQLMMFRMNKILELRTKLLRIVRNK